LDRSEAKRKYKETKPAMGVYRIRNTQNGQSFVGFSTDLRAIMNRQRTELKFGSHRNAELLDQWKSFGESSFEFEILDELEHDEKSGADPAEDLSILAEMWVRRLEKAGEFVVSL
jgi:hypothetical protein